MKRMAIGIVGAGDMGSAVAKRLLDGGHAAATLVEGRSRTSRSRVETLGIPRLETMQELAAHSDLVLSIVPPAAARETAQLYDAALRAAPRQATYVDCNAVAPQSVREIETIIVATGAAFIDAGIIGGPPREGETGPIFFCSGNEVRAMVELREAGLEVRSLGSTVGAASALKMSYGGITKGLTALSALMQQHARGHGLHGELDAVLQETRPELWQFIERGVPAMYPKAYRWVAEMREIATFTAPDEAGAEMFEGAARFYERVAYAMETS